jgi:adenine-specific DNA glycosylase
VNAHLWEFPNTEIFRGNNDLQLAADSALGIKRAILEPICRMRHSITRYAISLDVYGVAVSGQTLKADGEWVKRRRLDQLPFCAAHKRILRRLGSSISF